MRSLTEELAELEAAVDELRAAIAAPLRELAITALAIVSTPRSIIPLAAIALGVAAGAWLVYSVVDTWLG